MSIVLELPETLESEVRAAAQEQGETLDTWFAEMARRELARQKETRRKAAVQSSFGMFPMGNSDEFLAQRREQAQLQAEKIEGKRE